MPATRLVATARQAADDFGIDDLRAEMLRWVVGGAWLAAGALVAYLALASFDPFTENWLLALALLASGAAAWWLLAASLRLAAIALSVGLLITATAALFLYPGSPVACVLSLVVLVANILIGPRAALTAALGATGALVAASYQRDELVSDGVALTAYVLIWANAALAWLGSQPLFLALHWAWSSFVQAQGHVEQLRDSRGELGRISKSLHETCGRLEEINADLNRARRAAEEARRQKADFAAAVSHELRTPINLIIGFSELMISSPDAAYGEALPETYREDLEAIYRNAAHVSHLIDDILDLSQIEAHRMGLRRESFDLGSAVEDVASAVASLFRDKRLYLRNDVTPELPPVYADPIRVRQVLLNLLSNATRFTDEGGVTVSARCDGEGREVTVTVADTGVGIQPSELPFVFQEFRQCGGPGRRKGGSGLGLAVSKHFVELLGGSMWVESQPSQGSAFHFTLPVGETAVVMPLLSEPDLWTRLRVASDGKPTLAVLDRTPDRVAAGVLQRYVDRFTVVEVKHLGEARHLLDQAKPHALLIAGTQSVRSTVQRAQAELSELPIAFCSLRASHASGGELGAHALLVKPVVRQQLQAALRRLGPGVRRVLIVDDETEMVRLLAQMVRTCPRHYDVWEAGGGADGLRLLQTVQPDVVLLDLVMPEVDGYAFLETMRGDARLSRVQVIVITARGYEEQATRIDTFGVTRAGGLTIGEGTRCLEASLSALLSG